MASDDIDFDDKAEWSSRNEAIFIRILHEHVKMGDLEKSTFSKKTWYVIDDELYAETNRRYTVPKLKSKFNRLRKKLREFSDLIKHPGFEWDPATNTVIASDEVWAEYSKRVPSVKPYRKKGLEQYHILGEIFNTSTATSQMHFSLSQFSPTSEDEHELRENLLNSAVNVDVGKDVDLTDLATECQREKRVRCSVNQSFKSFPKLWYKMENYLAICSEVMSQKLEKTKEKNCNSSSKNMTTEMFSIQQCIDAVEAMGDVDTNSFNKLMDKIVHLEWRKVFLGMNDERKRGWLASL